MTTVVFFEKPGCGGNARQRRWLEDAGCTLEVRSLAAEPWSAESLLCWLAPLPHTEWFNPAAPLIKTGAIKPEKLDRDGALSLLLAEPLLIRRPLMSIGDRHLVGFDTEELQAIIGRGQATKHPRELESCRAHACTTTSPAAGD